MVPILLCQFFGPPSTQTSFTRTLPCFRNIARFLLKKQQPTHIWTVAFSSLMWPVDGIFVLLGVITLLYRDTGSACIYGRPAFAVAGPAAWNILGDDLRDPTLSTDSFRRLLNLFSEY